MHNCLPTALPLPQQSNIVDAPKLEKVEKVRDPVPDEQLAKLKDTLARSHAAQAKYATYTQVWLGGT